MRSAHLLKTVLIICAVVQTSRTYAQHAPSARAFLQSMYARYTKDGPGVEIAGSRANRYLHSSLIALIREDAKAVDGVGVLDGDPLCGCQDWDGIYNLKIDMHESKAGRTEALVSFAVFKDVKPQDIRSLRITLAREKGAWRVFNVVDLSDPKAPFDLRKALEKEIGAAHRRHHQAVRR